MKNFLSVFKKQKTEVFENALVWTGPKRRQFYSRTCSQDSRLQSKAQLPCRHGSLLGYAKNGREVFVFSIRKERVKSEEAKKENYKNK